MLPDARRRRGARLGNAWMVAPWATARRPWSCTQRMLRPDDVGRPHADPVGTGEGCARRWSHSLAIPLGERDAAMSARRRPQLRPPLMVLRSVHMRSDARVTRVAPSGRAERVAES